MKEVVTKELVEKVMDHIYNYNSKVSYRVLTQTEADRYKEELVKGIVKEVVDKIL